MNKKEVLEIRKQFSPKNCAITKICGCYVDYEKIYNSRFRLLRKAFENYDCETDQEYRKFVKENAAWLEDYSLVYGNQGQPEWDQLDRMAYGT